MGKTEGPMTRVVRTRLCLAAALLTGAAYMYFTLSGPTTTQPIPAVNSPGDPLPLIVDTNFVQRTQQDTEENVNSKDNISPLITSDNTLAKWLEGRIRVLCWIAVTSETMDRASIIMETWGRRCTKILLIGDETTKDMENVVYVEVKEGRGQLWPKTREAFRYIYEHHVDEADWFLKADTDTYVIMENLRLLLSQQDDNLPSYLGCTLQLYTKNGYNSGGAGYVLNKVSLKKLVTEAFKDRKCEGGYTENEDTAMGYCMGVVDIKPGDPTDSKGKNRFFPFEPADHINKEPMRGNVWYWFSTFKPGPKNMDCCSETTVSFHYVSKQLMYNMEFLLYHVKVFGMSTWFDMSHSKGAAAAVAVTNNMT